MRFGKLETSFLQLFFLSKSINLCGWFD
jgi:hypothetical protein